MLLEGEAIYAASKSALATMTRIFAREVAAFGITCNVVGPGPVDTQLLQGLPAAKLEALVQRLPLKRMTTTQEVVELVRFLCSAQASGVTAQVIYLGGV
jgi:3-oxoacyl-[acyl-carrier protein] reductase